MSSYLNINKLHEELEQRRIRRRMIYDTVLESVTKRIQYTNSSNDNCYLFYPVPGFISGMPIRDRPACMKYVMEQLTKMGFITRYVQPNYIYVSWRHAKYQPIDPSSIQHGNPHGYELSAADMGYRLPDTGAMSSTSTNGNSRNMYKNKGQDGQHLMSFTDQVRANKNPMQSKMLEFESIDEQFLAGNEHYNPNFETGSIYNSERTPILNEEIGVPSHIMRAHRPFLDPTNPKQPEPSLPSRMKLPTQQQGYYPQQQQQQQYQQGQPAQIKSVSFSTGTGRGGRLASGTSNRQPRSSNGALNLDDLLSPKSTSSNRVNSIAPMSPASPQQLADNNQQINSVLAQFGSNRQPPNAPPPDGIPNDMLGTLL